MKNNYIELFVPGRLCLVGEHSDWAGKYRSQNNNIEKGYAIVTGINEGIYAKVKKMKIVDILDYLAPIIPLCQAIGRWGNYINVEAYGTETNWPLRMEIVEHGITKYVHPTFLYESVGNLIVFFILYKLAKNRKFPGQIACAYFIGYAFVRFFVEGLRTDSLMWGPIRVSQALSLLLFIGALIVYIYKYRKAKA